MAQENMSKIIEALKIYASTLKQLQNIVVEQGKSSSIQLLQDISKQDIGLLCWQIPETWRSYATYSPSVESLLTEIQKTAITLGESIKGKEHGLPTLTLVSDQIVINTSRVLKDSSSGKISANQTVKKEKKGFLHKILQLLKGTDVTALKNERNIQGLLNALHHKSPKIRAQAILALGQIGGDQFVKPITIAFNDNNELVRKAAAESLQSIGGPLAETELTAFKQRNLERKLSILDDTIDKYEANRNVRGLIKLLEDKDLRDVKLLEYFYKIIDALENLGLNALVPLLSALGDSKTMDRMLQAKQNGLLNDEVIRSFVENAAKAYHEKFAK